jgi:transcriptional regulator with XRE-family HTH domain
VDDPLCGRRVPTEIDRHVGARLRLRRRNLGMTEENLAVAVGLTFQQIREYEAGQTRVPAPRLYDLARALTVSIAYFFDGLPD